MNLTELKKAMDTCEQMSGMSVYQHGLSVQRYFLDLYDHLKHGTPLKHSWRLPDWVKPELLDHLLPMSVISTYHDVGKPFCRTVDEDGRAHFPNHARVSHDVWLEAGGDEQVARLILMDMDIHVLKGEQVDEFASRPEAITLLLTGLAEIHSNAEMFGGIDSTSFKIKWKQIDRHGRQIIKKKEI